MHDPSKSYQELIKENSILKQKIREIEQSESKYKQAEEALKASEKRFREIINNTERKRTDETLLVEKQLSEAVINSLPGVFYFFDDQVRFQRWNKNFEKVLGYSAEEISRMHPLDFFTGKDRQLVEQAIQEAFTKGEATVEAEFVSKDNRRTPYLFTGLRFTMGNTKCIIGMGIDITDRKRAEDALQESENKFKILAENSPIGINIFQDGVNKYVNQKIAQMFGFTVEEFVVNNITLADIVHPDDLPLVLEYARRLLEGGDLLPHYTFRALKKNGEIINVEVYASKVMFNNKPALIGSILDVTDRKKMENALQVSEEKYRDLFENVNDGIFLLDKDNNFREVNKRTEEILGYTREELLQMNVFDLLPKELKHSALESLAKMREMFSLETSQYKLQNRDGRWIDLAISASVIMEGGEYAGLRAVFRDISDQKRMEAELRASEKRYRDLVETLPAIVYSYSDKRGGLYYSSRVEEVLGFPLQYLYENPFIWKTLVHPEEQATGEEAIRNLPIGNPFETEYRVKDKEGKWHWFLSSSISFHRGDDENIINGLLMDITEHKQAEEALLLIKKAIDSASDAIGMSDPQGRHFYQNKSFTDMFEYTEEELEAAGGGKTAFSNSDTAREVFDAIMNSRSWSGETEITSKSGRRFPVFLRANVIKDDTGRVISLLGTFTDITERKKAEEEKRSLEERLNRAEKMEALGTMAGGVAHDLNNVLGIVVGYAEMLLMAVDESRSIRTQLVKILQGGQRAAAIVDDLLTLARRGVSDKKVLNLNKIIAETQRLPEFEKLHSCNSSVKIETDLEPDLLNVSVSSIHLSKTLFSLISNASEAMPKGGILNIKTANRYVDKPIQGYDEVREGDYVVLSVSDTGEGVPAADLKRIFEPFYTKKVMGRSGTGLGLAVVWGTVKDHHGYINVQSEEGKGSTFTLYMRSIK